VLQRGCGASLAQRRSERVGHIHDCSIHAVFLPDCICVLYRRCLMAMLQTPTYTMEGVSCQQPLGHHPISPIPLLLRSSWCAQCFCECCRRSQLAQCRVLALMHPCLLPMLTDHFCTLSLCYRLRVFGNPVPTTNQRVSSQACVLGTLHRSSCRPHLWNGGTPCMMPL
jgi:hypothetical protein